MTTQLMTGSTTQPAVRRPTPARPPLAATERTQRTRTVRPGRARRPATARPPVQALRPATLRPPLSVAGSLTAGEVRRFRRAGLAVAGRTAPAPLRRDPRPARPLVLTRRGRLVVTAVVALVLTAVVTAVLALAAGAGRGAAGRTAAPAAGRTAATSASVVVAAGDTLWSVARDVAPGADPRTTIDAIARANHLDVTAPLLAGRQLLVPATR